MTARRRHRVSRVMARSRRSGAWDGFRSVLCPVDFSSDSRLALAYAAAVARRAKGALTAFHANDPFLIAAAAVALHDRRLAQRSRVELRRFVDETLMASSPELRRVRAAISTGRPADEILKATVRGRSDLIVLGTHGLTGANRLFLGSTTLTVLQRTTVPILAIPRSSDALPLTPSWPGDRIAVALDLENDSRREALVAARIAKWFDASLLLFHVVTRIAAPDWLKGDLSAHDRIRVGEAQRHIDAAAAAVTDLSTETRVVCGEAPDEIAALAATERIGLVLTALRDRSGWFGSRRGAISYHVLSHATTPVLAFPPGWRPE